jgi:hypothetical protein
MLRLSTYLAAATVSFALVGAAQAANDRAKGEMDRADSQYRIAKERCDSLKGKQEDVCEKEAKAARDKAKADARVSRKDTPESRGDAGETKAKADYRVQKEKCEMLKGKDQDACESQAKASLQAREAQADKIRKAR